MLNRAVLIVRPRQPFLDWAAQLDDSGLVPDVEGEQTVYLIPEFGDDDEAPKVLGRVFAEVFERELFGWHTDEAAWPQKRTLAVDIRRLLGERPKALGLAVPGMPAGAPGMDAVHAGGYEVLLFQADGATRVYHAYPKT